MKSLFSDLDALIEQAVKNATNNEKALQKKQEKAVIKQDLRAESDDEKQEEAETDSEETKKKKSEKGDESIPKITGKENNPQVSKTQASETNPGTKTSKKLHDPPEKVLKNPRFTDIRDKVNALRGSGSLADNQVADGVKQYLSKLSDAEKSALLTYLTNLAQIMTTIKSANQVSDPSDIGINTRFTKKNEKPKKNDQSDRPAKKGNVIVVGEK